jgi:magnesium-transporting ATPase (P-type)
LDSSFYTGSPEVVFQALKSSPQGLTEETAAARLRDIGPNQLLEPRQRPLWRRFLDQLTHFMALLLWAAGLLAFIARSPELGWAIWAVIWINALFSFWQEYRAEKALAELKKVLPQQVKVIREGRLKSLPARDLVPGDLVQLEEGDRVPADARLVDSELLYVDVSVLTGESLPVARQSDPVQREGLRPVDLPNLVLAGSSIAVGRGRAVVLATGSHTEFGRVAQLTADVIPEPSTLEVQVKKIIRVITSIALGVGLLVFSLNYLLAGIALTESFIFSIGIIVAMIPEGLLPTVTLSLAIGVQRMAGSNALVRRLSAVETLSATSVICTDKTGTLTRNEMTVRALWIPSTIVEVTGSGYRPEGEVRIPPDGPEGQQVKLLLAGAALCSNARLIPSPAPLPWQEIGDPTEAALLVAAAKAGLDPDELHRRTLRRKEIPFDAHRKMMTVLLKWERPDLWSSGDPFLLFTKGAPLEVLHHCRFIYKGGGREDLDETDRKVVLENNDRLAREGYRVLGLAIRPFSSDVLPGELTELEQGLTFLGLIAMQDPPRPEVKEAIQRCRKAGIAVTMITGDYGLTAEAIGRQIGLVEGPEVIISGKELDGFSDAGLQSLLKGKSGLIFARVLPEHKLRLVSAYQALGDVVAVTGDGVNDAPALRAAHIGLAMGLSGTEVAREAADIVLTDDNFATIVSAIEQGRAIYFNIRNFFTYILASNIAELVPFLAMVFLNIPPALKIMQILAIDLGTDMIPALALGAETPEEGLMDRPPRSKEKSLLDGPLLWRAYGFLGFWEGLACLGGFFSVWWAAGYSLADLQRITAGLLTHTADPAAMALYSLATTMALTGIVACQDGNVFACRSERSSIFRLGFFSNRWIWLGIAVEWALILSIIYLPPLARIFETAPPTPWMWLSLLIWPVILLGAEEIRKAMWRRSS